MSKQLLKPEKHPEWLQAYSAQYPLLPITDIITGIESGSSKALAEVFRCPATASVCGHGEGEDIVEFWLFRGNNRVRLRKREITAHAQRRIKWRVQEELNRLNTLAEYLRVKKRRGHVVTGQIHSLGEGTEILVWITIEYSTTSESFLATYPLKHQPVKERSRYRVGDTLDFFISSVYPAAGPGGSSLVKITVSRTAKDFPKVLLEQMQPDVTVTVLNRYPGHISTLLTSKKLKRKHIRATSQILGERILVVPAKAY